MSPLSFGRNTGATCGKYSPGNPQPDELSAPTPAPLSAALEVPAPALTLREVLALDPVQAARPELLAGEAALDRPVRWVHSSEVYEGANFLDGGELLLTNGFGLTDAEDKVRRRYVRELSARGAVGLAVEVGRALPTMPGEVVDEARRLGLPLLALHRVVPFVRITEAANRAIVTRGLSGRTATVRPWGGDHVAALLADLADGQALNQPEVEARAALAGFHPGPGARLIGVSVHGTRETGALDRAVRLLGGAGRGCCGPRSPGTSWLCSRCRTTAPATRSVPCRTPSGARPSRMRRSPSGTRSPPTPAGSAGARRCGRHARPSNWR
ncbi:PucR family transcriptional regulator ligand-binding domain-containing protein [Streptomyces sp. NPDC001982]|uniref:PucR family transcriptional regulator ligand-binding domain-containing protein n=1 Tax=Streptomyces sp. NPDC001982 TaxID=3154405 RepID=UPI00332FE75A